MTAHSIKPFQLIAITLLGILVGQQYSMHNALLQPSMQSLAAEIGRYQLLELSNMRRDRFMVDTKTGRAWNIVCSTAQSKHNGDNSVTPEDCLSESFEAIKYGKFFAPGPDQWEESEHLRAEKISLMTSDEHKAMLREEEVARVRQAKLDLMDADERKIFLQGEEK